MAHIIVKDSHSLTKTAKSIFLDLAEVAIKDRGLFSVALAGGSTPEPLYLALGDDQERVGWQKIHLFWGDERNVPADHPESNFRMVNEALVKKIAIPAENVHRVPAEKSVDEAAATYEEELKEFFRSDWPRFDLVLLGMGADGHTASLFPHSAGIVDENRWFIANFAPSREVWRLTLTKNAINAARNILILVKGVQKAPMVADVLTGEFKPTEKPIQLIKPIAGQLTWLLDREAASMLPPELLR